MTIPQEQRQIVLLATLAAIDELVNERAVVDVAIELLVASDRASALDTAIAELAARPTEEQLRRVQVQLVTSAAWSVGVELFVSLVARLVSSGHLTEVQAARTIALVPRELLSTMSRRAEALFLVAECVIHDESDGVLEVDADEVWSQALAAFRQEGV